MALAPSGASGIFGIDLLDVQFHIFHLHTQLIDHESHWIPAYAGMTVVVVATVKFPPSSRRRVRQGISNACVAPAEAVWLASQAVARRGIQCLSLHT